MATGRPWGQRSDWDPWRTLDCEYFICSNQYVPAWKCVHILVLTRSSRRRPFDQREVRLVALFHAELGRLLRQRQRAPDVGLAPQLRRTLECLAAGLSEREVAARLGMSPHTVHDHVKRLYRHFQAHSRVQLLAQLTWGPSLRTPSLCVAELSADGDCRFDSVELAEATVGRGPLCLRLGRGKAPAADAGLIR
jgi:DNA-binding CsgD family transcriptional regulator